ncbi:unnamed protein product, partial [Larinioides sclopetarius]
MNLREINSNDPSVLDGRTNDSSRTKFRALPRHTTKEIISIAKHLSLILCHYC